LLGSDVLPHVYSGRSSFKGWSGGIDRASGPRSRGLVMDGNGRWATQRGLPRTRGTPPPRKRSSTWWRLPRLGIRWLTVYASPPRTGAGHPRSPLPPHFNETLCSPAGRAQRPRVRIRSRAGATGGSEAHPAAHGESAAMTAHNSKLNFTVAFNYGGRAEIVDACAPRGFGRLRRQGTEKTIQQHLYRVPTGCQNGDPDPVVVRGPADVGETRVSNLPPVGVGLQRVMFTETFFPDFRATTCTTPSASTNAGRPPLRRHIGHGPLSRRGSRGSNAPPGRVRSHRRVRPRRAMARCGPSPRACADQEAASGDGSSRAATSAFCLRGQGRLDIVSQARASEHFPVRFAEDLDRMSAP